MDAESQAALGADWRVRLLGPFEIERDGQPIELPSADSARALLAFLLLNRGRPHARLALIDRFWPELEEARARRAFSQALWHVRRSVSGLVLADAERVWILPEARVRVDAADFEAATSRLTTPRPGGGGEPLDEAGEKAARAALRRYRGPLLEGRGELWIVEERRRYQARYEALLERVATADRAAGRFELARERLEVLLRHDPMREPALRELMRVFVALDRPAAALAAYERGAELLAAELGVDPDPRTRRLAEAIAGREAAEGGAYLPLTPDAPRARDGAGDRVGRLVGRRAERGALVAVLDAAVEGRGGLALIEGEAGIGKSRLVEELLADARWRGADALLGRAAPVDAPFGALGRALSEGLGALRAAQLRATLAPIWRQLLAPYVPALAEGMEAASSAPPVKETLAAPRLVQAFAELLAAWGSLAPLLLVLEDLHEADPDTLGALEALQRRCRRSRVLVLGSYRGSEARTDPQRWSRIRQLDAAGLCARLRLEPLAADDSAALLEDHLPGAVLDEASVAGLLAAAQGSPLYLLETLRSWREEGRLVPDGPEGQGGRRWRLAEGYEAAELAPGPEPVAPAVEALIEGRLDRLGADSRACLEACAVLGPPLALPELASLLEESPRAVAERLADLQAHAILRDDAEGPRFAHDLMRGVALLAMPHARYLRLHAAAGARRRAAGARDARCAELLSRGEDWPAALDAWLDCAERDRGAAANESAWQALSRAMGILEAHRPYPEDELERRRLRALLQRRMLAWMRGEVAREAEDTRLLAEAVERSKDPRARARILEELAQHEVVVTQDFASAPPVVEAWLTEARRAGDALAAAKALRTQATLARYRDAFAEALGILAEAERELSGAEGSATPREIAQERGMIQAERSISARRDRDLEAAMAHAGQAAASAEKAEDTELYVHALCCQETVAYLQGDLARCARLLEEGLQGAREIGNRQNEAVFLGNLGLLAWSRHRYSEAERYTWASRACYEQIGARLGEALCLDGLGGLYAETGRYQDAARLLQQAYEGFLDLGQRLAAARTAISRVRLATLRGRGEEARRWLERARPLLLEAEAEEEIALLGAEEGRLLLAEGRPREAVARFSALLEAMEAAGIAPEIPEWRALLARALQLDGDESGALDAARRAREDWEATIAAERVESTLWALWQTLAELAPAAEAGALLARARETLEDYAASIEEPEWRRAYRRDLPSVRGLREAWERGQASRLRVELRAADGGGLRWVEWTPRSPEDDALPEGPRRRRHRLARLLQEAEAQGALAERAALAEALGVSKRTVERDLAALRAADDPTGR